MMGLQRLRPTPKVSDKRFADLNRTELYELANAIWWACMDAHRVNQRTIDRWWRLHEIVLEQLRKSGGAK